ncbi:MAG: MFS transporter [Sphingobacteriaceae bacterium]|nr:MAG: MFS transporter [Sphingobacteriaceae bacterium]
MGLSYVIIKTMCSFSRNSLMKILSKYFQHKDFGTVNNLLSGFGAVSNACCMLLMTLFFRNNWKWSYICYLIAGVVFILNVPLGFVKREPKPITNARTDKIGHNGFVHNISASLKKPIFYVLLLLSMCISVVRVNTSFISW